MLISCVPRRAFARHSITGFMLVEVLVSILLFALGFVALMGLQSKSVAVTRDVEYRAESVQLANAYVARMWAYQAEGVTSDVLRTRFQTNGVEYEKFKDRVKMIPGAQDPVVLIEAKPKVITVRGTNMTIESIDVTITIRWEEKVADQDNPIFHVYAHKTSIGFQPIDVTKKTGTKI